MRISLRTAILLLFSAATASLSAQTPSGGMAGPPGPGYQQYPTGVEQVAYETETSYGHQPRFDFSNSVRLDTPVMTPMLDFQNRQGDKQVNVLESLQMEEAYPTLILGAQFRLSGMVARTNTADHFSYLGRFPTDFTGNSATDLRVVHANQAMMGHFAPWASGYIETLFSDVFSFPTFAQGSYQVRQAYAVFGNLDVTPFYAFIGKKNVSFGHMGTLSPFSQSMVWHYFAPVAEGAGVGFSQDGLDLTFTGLNGSRGIRVADSPSKGTINNFAANASYTMELSPDVAFAVGAGYLHGTIYDVTVPEHFDPNSAGPRNGAWDINGRAQFGPVVLNAEYVQTENDWPSTNHPVHAYTAEVALDGAAVDIPFALSASWSEGIQGSNTDEFEFNQQLVIGLRYDVAENIMMSFEYIRSQGFAPLINITNVSDKSVRVNTYLVGLVLTI